MNEIANQYTAIQAGLERIEEERKRKFNPPLVFELSDDIAEFAWEVIQGGRMQQTAYWCRNDGLVSKDNFMVGTTVRPFVEWLDGQTATELQTFAGRPFGFGIEQADCIANLKRLFARLRLMKII